MDRTANDARLTGREAVDERHQHVGKVTDVMGGRLEGSPAWATVKTGLLGAEHAIPLDHAYVAQDGVLVVPFARDQVKHSPKVPKDHVITSDLNDELLEYYALAS